MLECRRSATRCPGMTCEPAARLTMRICMSYLRIGSRLSTSLAAAIEVILLAGVGAHSAGAGDVDAPAAAVTALQCGHLIDTANGKTLGETTIVIEGGRIKEVLSGGRPPSGAKVID